MIPQLESAYAKLERADKHIFEFKAWVDKVFASDAYTLAKETEADGIHEVLKIRYHLAPRVSNQAITIVGDAIHNLRSALDHLACAVALRHNANVRLDGVYFPICRSKKVFTAPEIQGKIRILGPTGQAFISRLKPYAGDDGSELFWTLHQLDITDKHRMLLTADIFAAADGLGPEAGRIIQHSARNGDWQSLAEDVIVARWRVGEPEPNVFHIFNIAFNEPQVIGKQPAFAVLMNVRGLVQWTLSDAEREIAW